VLYQLSYLAARRQSSANPQSAPARGRSEGLAERLVARKAVLQKGEDMATGAQHVARRSRTRRSRARLLLGGLVLAAGIAGAAAATTAGSVQIHSDEFTGPLDTSVWTFVDPLGDSSLASTGTSVVLSVPPGVAHDLWEGANHAPRLLQDAPDVDLDVEVKFDSPVTERFQLQGLLFVAAADDFIRYEVHSDGSATRLFAATFAGGAASVVLNEPIADGAPVYLRAGRSGDTWTLSHSSDGSSWTTAHTFDHPLALAQVGVFAGNVEASPAHSAEADYFRNRLSPSATTEAATAVGFTAATLNATVDPRGGETTVRFEFGAASPFGATTPPQTVSGPAPEAVAASLTGLEPGTTYHARVVADNDFGTSTGEYVSFTTASAPPAATTGTAGDVSTTGASLAGAVTPNGAATTFWFEYGTSTGYGASTAAQIAGGGLAPEAVSAALSGLVPGTTYHFRLAAQNAFGTSHGADATFTTSAAAPTGGGTAPGPSTAPPPPPAPQPAQTGPAVAVAPYAAVVWGTAGDDLIEGTAFGEAIGGRAGNDVIRAGGGDDRLYGGEGDDLILGEDGNDRIWGGPGDDRIAGGAGNDRIGAGPGDDLVYGGEGDDVVSGGPGRDRLFGGPGDDLLLAADGERDVVDCGPGRDTVIADFGDVLIGCEVVRRIARSLSSA
jgi:hypothetical protein